MENLEVKHGNPGGLRRGVMVLIALAVLTGIEYGVAVLELPAILLWILALMKAAAVLYFFMHVTKVFRSLFEGVDE